MASTGPPVDVLSTPEYIERFLDEAVSSHGLKRGSAQASLTLIH